MRVEEKLKERLLSGIDDIDEEDFDYGFENRNGKESKQKEKKQIYPLFT